MEIFLSHSSKDKPIVDSFIYLLSRIGIPSSDVFCTSNNSLVPGEDFITSIKKSLQNADLVIFLISPNYIDSYFCLMEMGASWAFKENILPIIIPPLSFDWLQKTPLSPLQSIMINQYDDLLYKLYLKKLVEGKLIKRLNMSEEKHLDKDIYSFINEINDYAFKETLDLSKYKLVPIGQNSNPESLEITQNNNTYKFKCDFSTNENFPITSHFLSGVFMFKPYKNIKNFSNEIIMSFECRSVDNSIFKLALELKSGDRLFKFFEQVLDIGNKYKKFSISIDTNQYNYYLNEFAEICFVIRPNYLSISKGMGTLEIKNLKLVTNNNLHQ